MPLSWNEIKDRALAFSKEWAGTYNEEADAKPFLEAFFNVFGITRKKIATFEHKVKKLDNHDGYIDLLWKSTLLVEMKSKGKNLDKAYTQAREYLQGIKNHELPQYILISDFETFRLYDYESGEMHQFLLKDFIHHVQHFGFIAGYIKRTFKEQDPVNIKAANLMGKLHDRLKEIGYDGHPLELYLVRLLFCLFAEDTTIFEKDLFRDFILDRTAEDGSDLAARLSELFYILNTPTEKRLKNIDEQLNQFPYVNGKLFEEPLPPASFDTAMRNTLLECCGLYWGGISPAIFGSMFQSVMNPQERRNLGAHYTSEKNILKLIKPLFLDELLKEFESVKNNRGKLTEFHKKLSELRFLDPACGCGNFLIITYRELRLLEIDVLRALNKTGQGFLNVGEIIWLDVDMMCGIEYEEFPAQIAQVAMWLIDHQMNMLISAEFGQYFVRLPLKKAAKIVHGNALQMDWQTLLNPVNSIDIIADHANIYLLAEPKTEYKTLNVVTKTFEVHKGKKPEQTQEIKFDYIMGNPPFIGTAYQNENQKADMEMIFANISSFGMLDYVTAWYLKAAQYIKGTKIKAAFVSTNSISQGEQVGILWGVLFNKFKIKIHFAHRTFSWNNEAKGNAAVHVVIIGFANYDTNTKTIYEYDNIKSEPLEITVKNINPYLVGANDTFLNSISNPISSVPKMQSGSAARDGGFLILSNDEKQEIVETDSQVVKFLKRFISGDDFLNNIVRWCIWLKDANPNEIRDLKILQERFKNVKAFREKSTRAGTKKMAALPYLFAEERQPNHDFMIFPKVSSENRKYIPIAYLTKDYIVSDKTFVVPNTTLYHFGILTSLMHNVWMRYTCGRMKSDFSYSNTIVYNNYPWPQNPTEKQVKVVETAAQNVLDARALVPNSSLADLYHPLSMPPALVKTHQALDKAVDACYRPQPFTTDANRMEFLFALYETYTAGLFATEKKSKKKKETL